MENRRRFPRCRWACTTTSRGTDGNLSWRDETAVKLRAEEGRSIRNTDISLFINDLPNGKNTKSFSTPDASGSTSQAAGVLEGIEAGSRLFLIDESNKIPPPLTLWCGMISCSRSSAGRKSRSRHFWSGQEICMRKPACPRSWVAGSSGAFFYIADHIIQMDCYKPVEITERVKALCREHQAPRTPGTGICGSGVCGGVCGRKI